MATRPLSIAFIVRDPLPPLRADLLTLFGSEMPRHGIHTELVGQGGDAEGAAWHAGGMHVVGSLRSRFASVLSPLWDALGLLRAARRARPDCIQVRDKIASALLAWLAARVLRVPFVYWMSFPIVEGFEARRDALANRGTETGRGARGFASWPALWLAHALRARAARFVAYRLVLPAADHVFVQSAAMRDWLAGQGIARARLTAVPMGVDAALFERGAVNPSTDPRLDGRRVVLYLGRVARSRRSDFLLDVAERLRAQLPGSLLVIAGDAPSTDEMAWMREAIAARGLLGHVLLTGWLPQHLALGIPGVANDIPDQALVIEQSGAGLCVPMQADAFAAATLRLLADPALAAACAERGPPWVRAHRTYDILARDVALAYSRILPSGPFLPAVPPCTAMLTWSLKYTLRSILRGALRGLRARLLVIPRLLAAERSPQLLAEYVSLRARRMKVAVDPDGTRLRRVDPSTRLLTKNELRRDPGRFVRPRSPGAPATLLRNTIRTSGTSGSPLRLVQSLGAVIREEAFLQRQLHWTGWRRGQKRAWIRGDIVCAADPPDGRYWCHDWFGKVLMMSSYHLSNQTIGAYIDALARHDPVLIHAYPSSMAALAAWLEHGRRRYAGPSLRGVLTSSETLEPHVRAAIERSFGVRVFDWYGQAERVAAIGTCERGSYHVLTDYGGVELLEGEGGSCELVGTTLNNPAMPLQRYRTGDRVLPGSGAPCACGRVFPTVEAVIGRQEQGVTLPDGRIVTRLDRVFQGLDAHLIEGQVLYRSDGGFTLRVVTTPGFTGADEAALLAAFRLRVPNVAVRVEQVAAIARGPNGKFEFITQDG